MIMETIGVWFGRGTCGLSSRRHWRWLCSDEFLMQTVEYKG